MRRRIWMLLPLWQVLTAAGLAAEPDAVGIEFFEQKIRPVLVKECYSCHSAQAKKVQGGLLLDTREGMRKGGKSGPAVVPGNAKESLLLSALRYEDREMPPEGQLSKAVIADFEAWVARGAPDPRGGNASASGGKRIDFAAARKHWSYQPVRVPNIPEVRDRATAESPIDRLLLAKLESRGLSLSPPADRRTFIRRLAYDLTGLPPTYAEVEAFVHDTAPDAYERLVDRLLASPHYGERWGRHWLDVARYSDTKDFVVLKERGHPYAYTYRDYVIRAFNVDLPFDRFVHEQIAADLIEPKVAPSALAALGFLTLGRNFDGNIHDIYDDRIDTVSRGFLGLTVACARCHDHKYDAIASADYYALYGVFASSEQPLEYPLIDDPRKTPGWEAFDKQARPTLQKLKQHVDTQYQQLTETARLRVGDYLVRIATQKPDIGETTEFFLSLSPDDLRPKIVARWRRYVENQVPADDPIFGPWHDLMKLDEAGFADQAQRVIERLRSAPGRVNPLVLEALASAPLSGKEAVARRYGDLFKQVYLDTKKMPATAEQKPILRLLTERESPIYFPKGHAYLYMARVERDSYHKMQLELDQLAWKSPGAPPRAMALVDAEDPYDPHVFLRGSPATPGDSVPRRFVTILAGDSARAFPRGSGRLDLARAITAPDNPLTARVLVNRIWMHHFGEPLVNTPTDFGTRSDAPLNPELLDLLAQTLQDDGWSLKKLHRRLLLTRAYRQSSDDRPSCRQADPENRLLWRYPRRRLDLEAMRDTLLAVSGKLDRTVGGRPVDPASEANRRRTVYGIVDRQELPGLYRAFDFANPDQTIDRRPLTTVPQQALFAMNAPFMIEQARALAAQVEKAENTSVEQKVATLYRLVLARDPEAGEVQAASRFLAENAGQDAKLTPWQQYAQVLLSTNELIFVD